MANPTNSITPAKPPMWISDELPLVFAQGRPRSLESLSLGELQRFLMFLLQCCENRGQPLRSLEQLERRPDWWPEQVLFNNVLFERDIKKGQWSATIRGAIRNCYVHHKATYLLDFSGRLMAYMDTLEKNERGNDVVVYEDNDDGTRTLKNSHGKLLVTFRAENQDFDTASINDDDHNGNGGGGGGQSHFSIKSPLRTNHRFSPKKNSSDPCLPNVQDVYLCDTCDADFESLGQLMDHEQTCCDTNNRSPPDDDDGDDNDVVNEPNSASLFAYLNLRGGETTTGDGDKDDTTNGNNSKRPKITSYAKFLSIPFSSPLGRYLLFTQDRKSRLNDTIDMSSVTASSERTGGNASSSKGGGGASSSADSKSSSSVPPSKGARGRPSASAVRLRMRLRRHVHLYCFSDRQKRSRLITLETGLSPRALKLFRLCQKKRVFPALKRSFAKRKKKKKRQEVILS